MKTREERLAYSKKYYQDNKEKLLPVLRVNYKKWAKNNPEKLKKQKTAYRKRHPEVINSAKLKHRYGISLKERNRIAMEQLFLCAICYQPKKLFVDHNHLNKKVRGLLCVNCNYALGNVNDSILILKMAIKYLEKHGA